MGDKISLKVSLRDVQGKKVKQLRKQGLVPAVVYGAETEPTSVQAPYNEIEKVWRHAGKHTPVLLSIDTVKKIAMIKDAEIDPVKGRLQHVSFHAVKASDPVIAEVPIRLVGEGESDAERVGLIVLQSLEKIEIRALPMDLPEALEVSILALKEAGDHVTVGDIVLPENVEFVEHKSGHADEDEDAPQITDLTIATAYEPSALQAANEAAAGDGVIDEPVAAENGEAPAADEASTEEKPSEEAK